MVLKLSWWRHKTKQEQYWLQPFPPIQKIEVYPEAEVMLYREASQHAQMGRFSNGYQYNMAVSCRVKLYSPMESRTDRGVFLFFPLGGRVSMRGYLIRIDCSAGR